MKMPSIGFFMPNTDNSEICNQIFNSISKFIQNNPYSEIVVFSSQSNHVGTNLVPILHLSHAKFFDGILFLFDIPSLIFTKKFTNIKQKYFYISEMSWEKHIGLKYLYWRNLLADPDLNVISANSNINDIYNICWKETIGTAEEFNYEKLLKII